MKYLVISMLAVFGLCISCTAQDNIKTITPTEFAQEIMADTTAIVLDVRTDAEYAEGHLANAMLLDYLQSETFDKGIQCLDKSKTYYVYCRRGRRSHEAAVKMQAQGLKAIDMKGGITAWNEAKLPIDKSTTIVKDGIAHEVFKTQSGKEISIGLIKHGSLSISYDGYEIQIDPVANLGKPTDYTKLPKADVILVTHEHGDHLDATAIEALGKDNTVVYLNQRGRESLKKGEVLHNGDVRIVDKGISIKAVPAYNTTEGHLQFHPKGVGNGYVLTIDGTNIYVAGDTEDITEMAALKDIDVAFLPVNQPYTMTVEQAERAARSFRPKVLVPYHFGETDVKQLKQLLGDTEIDVRIRDMQ